jgi:hypothetical protein
MTRIQRLENEFIAEQKRDAEKSGFQLAHTSEILLRFGFSRGAMAIQDISYVEGKVDKQNEIKRAIGLFERSES